MTRKEAIKWLNKLYVRADITDEYGDMEDMQPYEEAIDVAIKALGQEPCKDTISRKAVLNKIKEVCFSKEQEWVDFRISQGSNGQRDFIIKFIENLPSIQPKSKTDVLDKIRAEIHATAEMHEDGDYYLRDEWIDEIIDKYKAESKNIDKEEKKKSK